MSNYHTYHVRILTDKLLTQEQRDRLEARLKEMLNGESSDFWELDEVEDVPELVRVEEPTLAFPITIKRASR